MIMTELNQDQISEIIDFIEGVACGGIYSRYSVRGMLGRSCLGLTYQDSRSLWRDAIGITCELNAEDPDDHLKLVPDDSRFPIIFNSRAGVGAIAGAESFVQAIEGNAAARMHLRIR